MDDRRVGGGYILQPPENEGMEGRRIREGGFLAIKSAPKERPGGEKSLRSVLLESRWTKTRRGGEGGKGIISRLNLRFFLKRWLLGKGREEP